jgi:hypothetical protein
MTFQLLLAAFACFLMSAHARPVHPQVFERHTARSDVQSERVSSEVIVGVIAVAVAVFGIASPLLWPCILKRLEPRRRRSPLHSTCKYPPAITKMQYNTDKAQWT